MLEKTLKQDQRVGRHFGVEERPVPVIPLARIERQPVTHRSERSRGSGKGLFVENLRADVAFFAVGAVAPLNHLGPSLLSG